MRRLIVNADDFGLTRGINRAIAELYDAGALRSATLMANGEAFEDAVAIAKERPGLGIGAHITIVDGEPVLPANEVKTLLRPDGKFREGIVEFVRDAYTGKISTLEVEREAQAQIEKLQRSGIVITHVDTHKHTHMFPRIGTAVLRAAERCGICAIRNPFEEPWSRRLCPAPMMRLAQVTMLGGLRRKFEQQGPIAARKIYSTDGTIGIAVTGTLDAPALDAMFDAMPDGVWELVCHPGYNDSDLDRVNTWLRESRDVERNALQQEIPHLLMKHSAVKLIHYGELTNETHS